MIVVNYNTGHLLERMFAALAAARQELRIQTVVVDNASRDHSVALLRSKFPDVELIENSINVGFARANNQAVAHIRGRLVLLLNTDAFIAPDTLVKTVSFMNENPKCGVLGVKLVSEDGSLQPCCRYFPTPWNVFLASTGLGRFFPHTRLVDDMSWDHASIRKCDWVPGSYYLTRREVVERVGLFDPRYFLYYEEVDLCRRVVRAGWDVIYYPHTQVVHIGGESAKTNGQLEEGTRQISALQIESELLYFRKHYGLIGMFRSVFLMMVTDTYVALKPRRDAVRRRAAVTHARTVLQKLLETRLASRPTV